MKIVLSRKGFDSGNGGCPSPVFPDQRLTSLPIPAGSRFRFQDLATPVGPMGELVRDLSGGRLRGVEIAHLDPDLWAGSMPRQPGWRPALGQVGAAQSHLDGQGVGPGDVMLFFGWFRPVLREEGGRWRYQRGSPEQHVLFGYLQIGESLRLGARPDTAGLVRDRPWLAGHPHVQGVRSANNTLHIASERLVLDGVDTGLPGGGAFERLVEPMVLTAPGHSKSVWRVPPWLAHAGLSYHGDAARWTSTPEGHCHLQSVAKGQEFVFDTDRAPAALPWLNGLLQAAAPRFAPEPVKATRRARGPGL